MTSSNNEGQLNDWSAVPGSVNADRALINRRVAYYGIVVFTLSASFYLYNAAMFVLTRKQRPPLLETASLLELGAMLLPALLWVTCRKAKLSLEAVRILDSIGLIGTMAFYAGMAIFEARGFEKAVAVASAYAEAMVLATIMLAIVMTHAVIVPASVRRTFWLSVVTSAIAPVGGYVVARVGFPQEALDEQPLSLMLAMYVGMWSCLTVAVSTIAARIIHGLKRRVREANEIGQYTLEEKIGEGGMGVVYLARHALLRRPTAVKLLHSDRAGEVAVKRFEQEVQLTSALTHPNTIAIFDFGRTPDGVFYYAMEYLDGITLDDLVTYAGAQPPARVVQILKQVCSALAEAHGAGLIHRDIKPANLMLCIRGRMPDQVKVLDFGLVKDHQSGEAQLGLSMPGSVLGTPAYLAPEAILDPANIDAGADLYAVGAVAYQLLVGEPVFGGSSIMEICAHHLHSIPVPPSERRASGAAAIPEELEKLILKCLAKDRASRPASAAEIITTLDKIEMTDHWRSSDAQTWWEVEAPKVRAGLKAEKSASPTPFQNTVAIDFDRRAAAQSTSIGA